MAPYTVTNSFKTGRVLQTYGSSNISTKRSWSWYTSVVLDSEPVSKRARIDKGKGKANATSAEDVDSEEEVMKKCIHQAFENVMKRERAAKNAEGASVTASTAVRKSSVSTSTTRLNHDAPSSPVSHSPAIFDSDHVRGDESDLSSPPRLSPPKITRKPAFSITKRKQEAQVKAYEAQSKPSGRDSDASNGMKNGDCHNGHENAAAKKPKQMTQMQLDLGQEKQRTCKECGLLWIPSNAEDDAHHKKYHKEIMSAFEGVPLGSMFLERVLNQDQVYECYAEETGNDPAFHSRDQVIYVNGSSHLKVKNSMKKVMEVVTGDLGAVPFDCEKLWNRLPIKLPKGGPVQNLLNSSGYSWDNTMEQYRMFLYLRGETCVGFLLAERIREGRDAKLSSRTKGANSEGVPVMSSSVTCGKWTYEAVLGISRIWVARPCRGQGIAKHLLECARSNFLRGGQIEYRHIAFSQPTESGIRLAQSFFKGKTDDGIWLVYNEAQNEY